MRINALMVVPPAEQGRGPSSIAINSARWMTAGRDRENEIVLDDDLASRVHSRLRVSENQLFVEDLGSTNGTWLIRPDGEEQRLESRVIHRLEEGDVLRVGAFIISPAERIGARVMLSAAALSPVTARGVANMTMQLAAKSASSRDDSALVNALTRPFLGDTFAWALEGLVRICPGYRGFLLGPLTDGFCVLASCGVDGEAYLSQRFVEETSGRASAWTLVAGAEAPEGILSHSLMAYSPGMRITGVPVRGTSRDSVFVGYIESSAEDPPELELLDRLSALVAPLLQVSSQLGIERRHRESLQNQLSQLRSGETPPPGTHAGPKLIGRSRRFLDVVRTIEDAADSTATVLIRGNSGTGKEELARLLHHRSSRAEQPFDVVNAAAMPDDLIESTLFGHDRGSFTGAGRTSIGAFERADRGTLFLDEIGDLSLPAQAKILRAIETGEIIRVGGTRRRVDVRLVTATHRDLEEMVRAGSFREDLFYRLKVIEVVLPTLAERPEDILELANHFVRQYRRLTRKEVAGITPHAARILTAHTWPGNIRELRNVVERALVLDRDGRIDADDLPTDLAHAETSGSEDRYDDLPLGDALNRFEREYLVEALARNRGQRQQTARKIGVSRRTLSDKIRKYQICDAEVRRDSEE